MFIASIRVSVDPDHRDIFEATFTHSMRTALDDVPGLARTLLLRGAGSDGTYVSLMEFRDAESFDAWQASSAFAEAHAHADDLGITDTAFDNYQVIEEKAATSAP